MKRPANSLFDGYETTGTNQLGFLAQVPAAAVHFRTKITRSTTTTTTTFAWCPAIRDVMRTLCYVISPCNYFRASVLQSIVVIANLSGKHNKIIANSETRGSLDPLPLFTSDIMSCNPPLRAIIITVIIARGPTTDGVTFSRVPQKSPTVRKEPFSPIKGPVPCTTVRCKRRVY